MTSQRWAGLTGRRRSGRALWTGGYAPYAGRFRYADRIACVAAGRGFRCSEPKAVSCCSTRGIVETAYGRHEQRARASQKLERDEEADGWRVW